MLPARVQGQTYRVHNETLDVLTGTEGPPRWEAPLQYPTVGKTTTIDGSGGRGMTMTRPLGAAIRRIRQAWSWS